MAAVKKGVFFGGLAAFTALFFLYYPPVYSIRDESDYLAMSYVLRRGTFSPQEAGIAVRSQIEARGRRVSDYPPGTPLALIPLTHFHWKGAFLLGFLSHLLGAFFFLRLLRASGLDRPVYFLLYFFFPAFVLYSRTLMSDMPAMACFLAGAVFHLEGRKPSASGFFFGLSALFRPVHLLFAAPFAAAAAWRARKNPGGGLAFFGAWLPFAAFIAWLQFHLYGGPWLSGYADQFAGVRSFALAYAGPNALHYAVSLLAIYPLMLAAPVFFAPARRPEILGSIALCALFYCFYFYHDAWDVPGATPVFGTRFLFPVMPFFLWAYAGCLERVFSKFFARAWTGVAALFLGAAGVFWIQHAHQRELRVQDGLRRAVYETTAPGSIVVYDAEAAELMQSVWGARQYLPYEGLERLEEALRGRSGNMYLVTREDRDNDVVKRKGMTDEEITEIVRRYRLAPAGRNAGVAIYGGEKTGV